MNHTMSGAKEYIISHLTQPFMAVKATYRSNTLKQVAEFKAIGQKHAKENGGISPYVLSFVLCAWIRLSNLVARHFCYTIIALAMMVSLLTCAIYFKFIYIFGDLKSAIGFGIKAGSRGK
jgi:hypothetical protein